jgi:hypothetical protein
MNNRKLAVLAVAVIVAVGTVFGVALTMQGKSSSDTCGSGKTGERHVITIQNDTVSPAHFTGKLCDTVTVTNQDPVEREIGFGQHDHHTPYDGVSEKVLSQDQGFTFTLSEKGNFGFHDHFHEEVAATFTVR